MSYTATGACLPGQVERAGGRCVSTKTAAASAMMTPAIGGESLFQRYKMPLIFLGVAAGAFFLVKKLKRRK